MASTRHSNCEETYGPRDVLTVVLPCVVGEAFSRPGASVRIYHSGLIYFHLSYHPRRVDVGAGPATLPAPPPFSPRPHNFLILLLLMISMCPLYIPADQDEARLVELGRQAVEVFVLAHVWTHSIEASYREAEALRLQEALLMEEDLKQASEQEKQTAKAAAQAEKRKAKKERLKAAKAELAAKEEEERRERERIEAEKKAEEERIKAAEEEKRRKAMEERERIEAAKHAEEEEKRRLEEAERRKKREAEQREREKEEARQRAEKEKRERIEREKAEAEAKAAAAEAARVAAVRQAEKEKRDREARDAEAQAAAAAQAEAEAEAARISLERDAVLSVMSNGIESEDGPIVTPELQGVVARLEATCFAKDQEIAQLK